MQPRRGWERAILLPGRIVTLPLSALAYASDHGLLYVEETSFVTRASFVARLLPQRFGVTVRTAALGDRTGLGGLIGLRSPFLRGALKNTVRVDFSGTTKKYSRTAVQVRRAFLSAEYGFEWRPSERFFGIGPQSSGLALSDYALQTEHYRLSIDMGWNRESDATTPHNEFRLWLGSRSAVTRTGREDGTPSFETIFPGPVAANLDRRVENLVYGVSLNNDWRGGNPHWSRGWRALLSAERFDRPLNALALRVGSPTGAQFTRYRMETESGFSFLRDPRTLRLLVRVIDHHVTSGEERVLLSDLAALGGREGLSGYDAGRFHDQDLALTRLMYVFPLVRKLEMEVHSEWGSVYPDVWGDLRPSHFKNSFGFSLRARTDRAPYGSIGMDFSPESVHLRYRLGGVE